MLNAPLGVEREDVVDHADVVHAARAADDDPAVSGAGHRVLDEDRAAVAVVDLDAEALRVVVDDVVGDEMVVALQVDAVALVDDALAVVVDPVAEDLQRGGSLVGVDPLVLRVSDLVARDLHVVAVEVDVAARVVGRVLEDEAAIRK